MAVLIEHGQRLNTFQVRLNMKTFIDCQFCENKKESKEVSEFYFKRNPNEILVRCSQCNVLQYWDNK
jgi:hypothetical protein